MTNLGDPRSKSSGGPGRQQSPARKNYVFTLHSEADIENEEDVEQEALWLIGQLVDHCSLFAFQLERAPTTGYMHYQGYFELEIKQRTEWVHKHITKFDYLKERKGTPMQAWNYATKSETRHAGPWTLGEPTNSESGAQKTAESSIRRK